MIDLRFCFKYTNNLDVYYSFTMLYMLICTKHYYYYSDLKLFLRFKNVLSFFMQLFHSSCYSNYKYVPKQVVLLGLRTLTLGVIKVNVIKVKS